MKSPGKSKSRESISSALSKFQTHLSSAVRLIKSRQKVFTNQSQNFPTEIPPKLCPKFCNVDRTGPKAAQWTRVNLMGENQIDLDSGHPENDPLDVPTERQKNQKKKASKGVNGGGARKKNNNVAIPLYRKSSDRGVLEWVSRGRARAGDGEDGKRGQLCENGRGSRARCCKFDAGSRSWRLVYIDYPFNRPLQCTSRFCSDSSPSCQFAFHDFHPPPPRQIAACTDLHPPVPWTPLFVSSSIPGPSPCPFEGPLETFSPFIFIHWGYLSKHNYPRESRPSSLEVEVSLWIKGADEYFGPCSKKMLLYAPFFGGPFELISR